MSGSRLVRTERFPVKASPVRLQTISKKKLLQAKKFTVQRKIPGENYFFGGCTDPFRTTLPSGRVRSMTVDGGFCGSTPESRIRSGWNF